MYGGDILKETECQSFLKRLGGIKYVECPVSLYTCFDTSVFKENHRDLQLGNFNRLRGEAFKAQLIAKLLHSNHKKDGKAVFTELEVLHDIDGMHKHAIVIAVDKGSRKNFLEVFDSNGKMQNFTMRREPSSESVYWIKNGDGYKKASNHLVSFRIHETNLLNWIKLLKAFLELEYSEAIKMRQILPAMCNKGCINSIAGYCRSWCLYYLWLRESLDFNRTKNKLDTVNPHDIIDINRKIRKHIQNHSKLHQKQCT